MPHTKEDELISLLKGQGAMMQEVYSILELEEKKDSLVRAAILASLKPGENQLPEPDPKRVFREEDIHGACVKYRLRFLPAGRFKGALPYGAVRAVRQLELLAGKPLTGFRIMAPAERFRLCDTDADPMLFVPLGGGSYYLVHRWGRDMDRWRALRTWPVRNWRHLVLTAAACAAVLAAVMPTAWITPEPGAPWWGTYRLGAFFCTSMVVGAAFSFCWMAFFGQFSEDAWRSKTFN